MKSLLPFRLSRIDGIRAGAGRCRGLTQPSMYVQHGCCTLPVVWCRPHLVDLHFVTRQEGTLLCIATAVVLLQLLGADGWPSRLCHHTCCCPAMKKQRGVSSSDWGLLCCACREDAYLRCLW